MQLAYQQPSNKTTLEWLTATAAIAIMLSSSALAIAQSDSGRSASAMYHDYCSVCHGESGNGRSQAVLGMLPQPRNFTSPASREGLTRDRMVQSVRNGVPGTAMVGWKTQLNDTEIEAIVDYVRERLMAVQPLSTVSSDGESIYAFSCSVCHGEDGSGAMWGAQSMNPPPVAFPDYDPQRDMPRQRMIASVTHGRPGTSMMAFNSQLSADQIELVVDYVRDAFMSGEPLARADTPASESESGPSPQPDTTVGLAVLHGKDQVPRTTLPDPDPANVNPTAPMPFGLTGDPARGGRFFAESCTACHGTSGDGQGSRAYFIFPRPLSFVAVENRIRLDRAGLFNSIKNGVRGREMPAWGKIFDDQTIADIAEFVFSAFVNPDAAAGEAER